MIREITPQQHVKSLWPAIFLPRSVLLSPFLSLSALPDSLLLRPSWWICPLFPGFFSSLAWMALLLRPLLLFREMCPTKVTEAGRSHTPPTVHQLRWLMPGVDTFTCPPLTEFCGELFHLNSFVWFFGAVLSVFLEGLEVAGRSHGLGCTAASNAGAIQSCSRWTAWSACVQQSLPTWFVLLLASRIPIVPTFWVSGAQSGLRFFVFTLLSCRDDTLKAPEQFCHSPFALYSSLPHITAWLAKFVFELGQQLHQAQRTSAGLQKCVNSALPLERGVWLHSAQYSKNKHLNNTRNMVERAPHSFDAMRRSAERKQGAYTPDRCWQTTKESTSCTLLHSISLPVSVCVSVLPPPSSALTCLGWLWFCYSCCCLAS